MPHHRTVCHSKGVGQMGPKPDGKRREGLTHVMQEETGLGRIAHIKYKQYAEKWGRIEY